MPNPGLVLAEAEIRALLPRERYYRDTEAWEKMRGCYHPDPTKTSINLSWYKGDVDGLIARSTKMRQGGGPDLIHQLVPGEVTISGAKAMSVSTCQIMARRAHNGTELDMSSWIRLVSRLEQVTIHGWPEWRILTMEAIYLRDSLALTAPEGQGGLQEADLAVVEQARPSYKYLSMGVSRLGMQMRGDLPGVDDPASVADVLARSQQWLTANDEGVPVKEEK